MISLVHSRRCFVEAEQSSVGDGRQSRGGDRSVLDGFLDGADYSHADADRVRKCCGAVLEAFIDTYRQSVAQEWQQGVIAILYDP